MFRTLIIVLLFSSLPSIAFAESIDTGEGVSFEMPDGWKKKKPGKSAVARLVSKEVPTAQIELRVAPVAKDKSEQFFTTFHASLLNAGMQKLSGSESASIKGKKAFETEYSVKKKGNEFRLFVVQFEHAGKAWLVVGMFPVKKRDRLYASFTTLLSAFSLV